MDYPFNGGNRAGAQLISFHNGCIHPSHAIKLELRPFSRIEKAAALEHADGLLDGKKSRASSIKPRIANLQGGS
jgi:hypothetical protein